MGIEPRQNYSTVGKQEGIFRANPVTWLLVFLLSYISLFLGMSRFAGTFDEGLVLTGSMRVAASQIPHRDFYTLYGPAQYFILAGLFRLFGELLLVERLFDVFVKALIVTAAYAITSNYCRRSVALLASVVTLLWLFSIEETAGSATMAVSLLNLVGSALIASVFVGGAARRRVFAAGAIAGLAALFRYDTGVAALGIHATAILIAGYLRSRSILNGLRSLLSTFWPYLIGFALLTLPPLIYYLSVAPLHSLVHDMILYPARHYHRARNVPFPRLYLRGPDNLGVYLPIPIAVISLYAALRERSPVRNDNPGGFTDWRKQQGFLVTFGVLVFLMYMKGFVRVSVFQTLLAIIPSMLLTAVLFQNRSVLPRFLRVCFFCLVCLVLGAASRSAYDEIGHLYQSHLSVAQDIFSPGGRTIPETPAGWCNTIGPLTSGLCFLTAEDRIQTIKFITDHTERGQKLFLGLPRHDRIFAGDNLTYFATQRLPATKWFQLDPDLETRLDIQTEMTHEFDINKPPYIVLDSEYEDIHEPNDSSKSSGVTLLDDYIRNNYQQVQTFGTKSIWRRRYGR
jgi:hypothetical protein